MGGRGSAGAGAGAGGGGKAAAVPAKSDEERVHDALRAAGAARAAAGGVLYAGRSTPVTDAADALARAGMPRADFDRALLSLERQKRVYLYSASAPSHLTPRQRGGGIPRGDRTANIARLND